MKKYTNWDFRRMTPEQRFLAKLSKAENGCLIWTGTKSKPWMYGQFYINNKPVWAHRFSYEYFKGPIPDGMCVLHKCDNPSCVNPDHLNIGTQAENVQDMHRKGRANNGSKRPGKPRRVTDRKLKRCSL